MKNARERWKHIVAIAVAGALLLTGCATSSTLENSSEPEAEKTTSKAQTVATQTITADQKQAYRIAILNDEVEGKNLAGYLEEQYKQLGYSAQVISFAQLSDSSVFGSAYFDCLAMPDSVHYPASASTNIQFFTESGGDLLLMGGHAFSEPMVASGKKWVSCDAEDNPKLDRLLGVFDTYEIYDMPSVTTTEFNEDQAYIDPIKCSINGAFSGVSAIGFETPDSSTFIPVLEALDADGIRRGWACGILTHYKISAGSDWMLFGIQQDGFYRSDDFIRLTDHLFGRFISGSLHAQAKEENTARIDGKVEPAKDSEEPMGIRLTSDGLGFEYEDGTPFFVVGANIVNKGSFNQHYKGKFKPALMEEDFQRLKRAGVNVVRLYGVFEYVDDTEYIQALKTCARKYGIYLLLEVSYRSASTLEALKQKGRIISNVFKDDPMVLGYDLQNEPYYWDLNEVTDSSGTTLAKLYPNAGYFSEYADYAKLDLAGSSWSTYPRVNGPLPTPQNDRQKLGVESVNGILGAFIQAVTDGIRENDKTHLITVGYNTPYVFLSCNNSLDFISNHVYENLRTVTNYQTISANITAMDRLRSVYKKPIIIGEFNVSNGDKGTGNSVYYDIHNSGVAEFIHYIYAYAKGYSGVMKWALTDWPLFNIEMETSSWWQGDKTWISEGRMGMYMYDGTLEGSPKPIAQSLKFLSDYVTETKAADRGDLKLTTNKSLIETGYVFEGKNALFVGDVSYQSDQLTFASTDDKPANVMLRWTSKKLTVMSTHDCEITIRVSDFLSSSASKAKITGKYKGLKQNEETITVTLFAGETVVVA